MHIPNWADEGKPPTNVPYVIGDGRHLPFRDESFDLVVSRAAVHGMAETQKDLEMVINDTERVLKPGGEFRFTEIGRISPVPQQESDKWTTLVDKFNNNQRLTPDEEAWRVKTWPAYERYLKEEQELTGLPTDKRIEKIQGWAFDRLREIDPSITKHQTSIHGEPQPKKYYIMKKPAGTPSVPTKQG